MENDKKDIYNLVKILLISIIYGSIIGVIVFLLKMGTHKLEIISKYIYEITKDKIILILLVFLLIVVLSYIMVYIHKKIPDSKGVNVYTSKTNKQENNKQNIKSIIGIFISSLISFIVGVSVDIEGPSVIIGKKTSDIRNNNIKINQTVQKYINIGGAAAGFSVATGAPFAGILYAIEEIHKKITAKLIIIVSLIVLSASTINLLLCDIFEVHSDLIKFDKIVSFEYIHLLYIILLAFFVTISVLFFNKITNAFIKIKHKIKLSIYIKILILFLITAIFGYIYQESIYNGHDIIEQMSINNKSIIKLLVLLFSRLLMIHIVIGSNPTGGIFIPLLAIASILGALFGKLFIFMGIDSQYYSVIVLVTIISFVSGLLRCPITIIILLLEITQSYVNIVYILIVVFIVNFFMECFNQHSYYDKLLEKI